MPYLGYLLAQAIKAGDTIATALTNATNFVTKVGGSVVDLSPSVEPLKSPSKGSAVFNGTSDYINVADPNFSTTDSFTVGGWVYIKSYAQSDGIILASETVGWGLQGIIQYATNSFAFYAGTGASATSLLASTSNDIVENTWIHVMGTHSPLKNSIYVNGKLSNSSAAANLVSNPPNQFKIGHYSTKLDGYSSNMAIWSRDLTASEVRSVMNKSYDDLNASETKGLVSWYALDDISGTTVPDSHGNYNGTAN
tara:strand:- start:6690 stop:7445 length:756 start_codon:yes stop_codon:yes gene_type:complete